VNAVYKAYKTPSDKNIADINTEMNLFEENLKEFSKGRSFWLAEVYFFLSKLNELDDNPDIQGPIYDVAKNIAKTIEGKIRILDLKLYRARENGKALFNTYSTLQLIYLPYIKPIILNLKSNDNPEIKLKKFKGLKQYIEQFLATLSLTYENIKTDYMYEHFGQEDVDNAYNEILIPINAIDNILKAAIKELDPNSGPLEKPEEVVPIVPGEIIEEAPQELAGETEAITGGKRRLRKSRKLKSRY